jgi:hypothetical protein
MTDEINQNSQNIGQNSSEPVQSDSANAGQTTILPTPAETNVPDSDALIQKKSVPETVEEQSIEAKPIDFADNSSPTQPIKDEKPIGLEETKIISDIGPKEKDVLEITKIVPETNKSKPEETNEFSVIAEEEKPQDTPVPISKNQPLAQLANQEEIFKNILLEKLIIARKEKKRLAEEKKSKILEHARANNRIDNKIARQLTGLSRNRIRYYLDQLEKENKLLQVGRSGPKVFYMPKM